MDWMFGNLDNEMARAHKNEWKSVFMVTYWYLWTCRNKSIFEAGFHRPTNPTQMTLKMTNEINSCEQRHMTGQPHQKDTIFIGWKQPPEGCVKLNCDDAYKSSIHLLGCMGILRDNSCTFLVSYACMIGACNVLNDEMRGMYIGMDLTWRQGTTHLQVDSDSNVLVDMVTRNCNSNGNISTLIHHIHDLKNMN